MACIRSPKCSMAYRSPIVFSNPGTSFIGFAPFELPAPSRSQMPWATIRRTFFCRKTQKCYTVFYAVCSISNMRAYCHFFHKGLQHEKSPQDKPYGQFCPCVHQNLVLGTNFMCISDEKHFWGPYIHLQNNALIKSPLRIVIYRVNFILISAALILELIHSSPVGTNPHFS